MDTWNERRDGQNPRTLLRPWDINEETERTYCFTTVCNKTGRLLEGFLQVVLEALVLVLLGAQLHEFTWKHRGHGRRSSLNVSWGLKFKAPFQKRSSES